MTQTEAFEANLSQHLDSFCLRGKLLLNFAVSTAAPVVVLPLAPSNSGWGARVNNLSSIFSKYRFKYINIRFISGSPSTTAGQSAIGVLDDGISGLTGEAPTTVSDVAELRCSGTAFSLQTTPTCFNWTPVDKHIWMDTTNDGTDARFSTSGILYAGSTFGTTSLTIEAELDYCIVFSGASNSAAF